MSAKTLLLMLAAVRMVCAQDLPAIHVAPDVANALAHAYRRKIDADAEYAQLERWAILLFATRPGGGNAGKLSVFTNDPIPGWEYGALFTGDFAVMVPRPKPEPPPRMAPADEHSSSSTEVSTIPVIPWLK